ncbi:hypothetical protein GUITHDRAFT_119409 [Guillardia theta CCMP2712]|uniref:DBC1/CARP1 catalytically inactive NUDIX hydrolase domain-containing protein n=1 Tax=Guillardia theta (strain CCMP2712) TaxID=905079 RepID=L1IE93_GUITC|nr:hypothetical protein GUITHDRAFT_119409 [Guillardia theta CCMP2712]EKX34407.1 hypothetical protein GUITHDRAFT_119409 [Guillardia theta CCMP2712]|eukprot:XP_005821387.1 hypothetical protein GUITHDRAFT_119409 [Guillardia theta CCMP2712]
MNRDRGPEKPRMEDRSFKEMPSPRRNLPDVKADSSKGGLTPEKGRYLLKIAPFPFSTVHRDYQQLRLRYPRLHVAQDFSRALCLWPEGEFGKGGELPLVSKTRFFCGAKKDQHLFRRLAEPSKAPPHQFTVKYNAKVMLLQGLPDLWWEAGGTSKAHLGKMIKFLCVKSQKHGLFCMGGMWMEEKDGGGSTGPDTEALIRTAIRCVKETIDVDLSGVKKWHRFMEIQYNRPAEMYKGQWYPEQEEHTIIFLPELEGAMPDREQFTSSISNLEDELNSKAHAAWEKDMEERRRAAKEAEIKRAAAAAAAAEAAKLAAAAAAAAAAAKAAEAEAAAAESISTGDRKTPAGAGNINEAGQPGDGKSAEVKLESVVPATSSGVQQDADASGQLATSTGEVKTEQEGGGGHGVKEEVKGPPPPEPIKLDFPEEPCILVRPKWEEGGDGKGQIKASLISLDGLLDYNLDDVLEKNFEVSLFAEFFHEMLEHMFASRILKDIQDRARENVAKMQEQVGMKRKLEEEDSSDPPQKVSRTGQDGGPGGQEAEEAVKEEPEPCGEEFEVIDKQEVEAEEQYRTEEVVDHSLRNAWEYFDKGFAE